jgi:predicted enzyme related to lactoylglutathione lyase
MKPAYFDLSVENLKEAHQFFENVFGWHFEKMPMPFEYYLIQAGDPDEPWINGGIGEIKDISFRNGKPSCVVTIPVLDLDESIAKVTESGGSIVEPEVAIPGIGWYATCAEHGGLMFGMMQADSEARWMFSMFRQVRKLDKCEVWSSRPWN